MSYLDLSLAIEPAKSMLYKKYRKYYRYKLVKSFDKKIDWLKIKDIGEVEGGWACLAYQMDGKIHLIIKEGYAWDGPSGPSIDTKNFMRSSLVHDALYQLMREGVIPESYRKKADQEMRKISLEDGMRKFRAWYTYIAVRLFGAFFARKRPKAKILSAP